MNAQTHTMKKTLKNTMLTAFAVIAGFVSTANAATVTWDAAWTAVTANTAIQTLGGYTTYGGVNFNGSTTTINNGPGGSGGINVVFTGIAKNGSGTTAGITVGTSSFVFNSNASDNSNVSSSVGSPQIWGTVLDCVIGGAPGTITLSGLTSGSSYYVQFFSSAPDANILSNSKITSGGGDSPFFGSHVGGGTKYIIATFTADGTSQSFTISGTEPTYSALVIGVKPASGTPAITAAATLPGSLTTTYGTPSPAQIVAVSGASLTANITATAQTDFQVSSDNLTYGSTATFTQSGGSASGSLYVRLAATAPVSGSYDAVTAAILSSTGASSSNVSTTASGNSVSKADPAVTVTVGIYGYTGSPQGPDSYTTTPTGDTGTPTWSYVGTDSTTYGPSETPPTAVGTYTATVSLAADSNFNAASSSATAFTIIAAPTIIAPATLPGSLATTYGTTSAVQSVSVSGADLVADITATAQTGFELSSDGSTFGATATFTNNSGTASGTLSVRLSATAPAAAYDAVTAAILSSTGAASVPVATTPSGNAVAKVTPTVTVTVGTYSFTGSAQGPNSYTTSPAGDTGTPTWSYEGTGSTSYGPSATRPTAVGTYNATVSLVADSNFNAASSSATAFSINLTPGVISWGTPTNITSANDISSAGLTGLAGANFGNPAQPATTPESVTVNNGSVDVIFTRVGANQSATLTNGITVTTANTWVNWGYSSGNSSMTGNYGVVLDTNIGRESATPLSATITLSGLVDGMQYRIQFWASATGQAADERISGSEALNTDTGSNGQFVTGNFIADGTSQVLTVTGLAGGENFIVANALTIGTFDFTPPTLPGSSIVDDKGGMPVELNTLVTYTVTFSEDMDASTVTADDFGNAGTAAITLGSVTETSPGVFTVQVTPTNAGTLTLKVNAGADLKDNNGYALNTASAILDDTTITVYSRGSVLLIQ